MPDHIVLIDGYNVIRRTPSLQRAEQRSLLAGRDALINQLAYSHRRGTQRITIVFDGAEAQIRQETRFGMTIVFTSSGKTADDWIIQAAQEWRSQGHRVSVCSDDGAIRSALVDYQPDVRTQSVRETVQYLNAPPAYLVKQHRHRSYIKQQLATDPDDDAPTNARRGNPHRAPRKRR